MSRISQKATRQDDRPVDSTAVPSHAHDKGVAVPFDVSKRIGLAEFKVTVLRELGTLPAGKESYDAVMTESWGLREAIQREMRGYPKGDPTVAALKEIGDLSLRLWECAAQLGDFEFRPPQPASSDSYSSELLHLAITEEREELGKLLEQLAALRLPTRPESSPFVKRASVAVATLGMLVGGARSLSSDDGEQLSMPPPTSSVSDVVARGPDENPLVPNIMDNDPEVELPEWEVSFPDDSTIRDVLWMGEVFTRGGSGAFVEVPRSMPMNEGPLRARVSQRIESIQPNLVLQLVAPYGFTPYDVHVVNSHGKEVPLSIKPNGEVSIRGSYKIPAWSREDNRAGYVEYSVTESCREVQLPKPVSDPPGMAQTRQHADLIEALRTDPSRVTEALDSMFRGYIYVTSADIDSIIRTMIPSRSTSLGAASDTGSFAEEEIYRNIGVADCDAASLAAAGILNEAGISAGVIRGYLERGGTVQSPHAKVLYKDHNGEHQTYESTRSMSEAFEGVVLGEVDKVQLTQLAAAVRDASTAEERRVAYDAFRDRIHDILAKPEYAQYQTLGSDVSGAGEMQSGSGGDGIGDVWDGAGPGAGVSVEGGKNTAGRGGEVGNGGYGGGQAGGIGGGGYVASQAGGAGGGGYRTGPAGEIGGHRNDAGRSGRVGLGAGRRIAERRQEARTQTKVSKQEDRPLAVKPPMEPKLPPPVVHHPPSRGWWAWLTSFKLPFGQVEKLGEDIFKIPQQETHYFLVIMTALLGEALVMFGLFKGAPKLHSKVHSKLLSIYSQRIRGMISPPLEDETVREPLRTSISTEGFERALNKEIRDLLEALGHERCPTIGDEFKDFEKLHVEHRQSVYRYLRVLHNDLARARRISIVLRGAVQDKVRAGHEGTLSLDEISALVRTRLVRENVEDVNEQVTSIVNKAMALIAKQDAPQGRALPGTREGRRLSRRADRAGDFDSMREIRPGEPIFGIDVKASLRTGKCVKQVRYAPLPRPHAKTPDVHFVVDAGDRYPLPKLAAALMQADAESVKSVTICARGNIIKTFHGPLLRKMLADDPKKVERIKVVIKDCVEAAADAVCPANMTSREKLAYERLHLDIEGAGPLLFPLSLLHRREKVVVFGNYYLGGHGA